MTDNDKQSIGDAHTLEVTARIDLDSDTPYSIIVGASMDSQSSEAMKDIVNNISRTLQQALAEPPIWEIFEKEFQKAGSPEEQIKTASAMLSFCGFRTDERHLKLLDSLNRATLSLSDRYLFNCLMFEVQKKRGEWSLALNEAEEGLAIAKELNDQPKILESMIAIGSVLCQLDSTRTTEHHQSIIAYAKETGLEDKLAWAYHNWGSYNWRKRQYHDALLLFERETELRRAEGPKALASHLGFLANLQETINPEEALQSYSQLLEVAQSIEDIFPDYVAEANYRMAAFLLKIGRPATEYLKHAEASYNIFVNIPGREARAAWAAGLIAQAHESMGNEPESDRFYDIKSQLLQKYGDEKNVFRAKLSDAIEGGSEDAIQEMEKIAISSKDDRLYLDWILTYSTALMQLEDYEHLKQLNEYGLGIAHKLAAKKQVDNQIFSLLYDIKSICYSKLGNAVESNSALKTAISYIPKNYGLRWKLCHNSYVSGDLPAAENEATYLNRECPTWPGPYQILSRILFQKGNVDDAITILLNGRAKTNRNKMIEAEARELEEYKQGLRSIEQFEHFNMLSGPIPTTVNEAISDDSMPEFRNQPDFFKGLVNSTCEMIYHLQKTPPSFLRALRQGSGNLDEGDFRDELQRLLSFQFKAIAGEVNHGKGRADLVVPNHEAPLPRGVVFEFKVWGRNDYLLVIDQLFKYLTDFEIYGIIFMINGNKSSISDKYRDDIIFQNKDYVTGSFRAAPITNNSNLDHFFSCHEDVYGRKVSIFHFIFNAL